MTRPRDPLYWGTESRLQRGPDGTIRSPYPGDWYDNYRPLLQHFVEVVVIARVSDTETITGQDVEGSGVRVAPLTPYAGARQALRSLSGARAEVRRIGAERTAFFGGKLPGLVGGLVQERAWTLGRPFLANVVGDPAAVLAAGSLGSIGRPFGGLARAVLRRQVRNAQAVVYVTEEYLQRLYPASPNALQFVRSNVSLPPAAFRVRVDKNMNRDGFRLLSIGSHEQLYKGHDLLLRAVATLRAEGHEISLDLIGAGRRQPDLRRLADRLGVSPHTTFHGQIGDVGRVRELLDGADLYAQPSRTEGLPRALLEAMARELPCVGSAAGGTPELLDERVVFAVDDLNGLLDIVRQFRDAPEYRAREGRRNRLRAQQIAAQTDPERYADFIRRYVACVDVRQDLVER